MTSPESVWEKIAEKEGVAPIEVSTENKTRLTDAALRGDLLTASEWKFLTRQCGAPESAFELIWPANSLPRYQLRKEYRE